MNPYEHFKLRELAYQIPREHHSNMLAIICSLVRAHNIVELGSGDGFGTAVFIESVKRDGGHVWSVDIGNDGEGTVAKRKYRHCPEVSFVTGDSVAYADAWGLEKRTLDLVYADSDHSREHVLRELKAWSRFSPKVIVIDDTLDANADFGSPLEAAIQFCETCPVWQPWNIAVHTGLCVLVPT